MARRLGNMAGVSGHVAPILENAKLKFEEKFGELPAYAAVAPGRVNLIGEHTDYNGGFVFPMAVPMVTVVVGRESQDGKSQVYTMSDAADEPRLVEFVVKDGLQPGTPKWANYVKGVIANFHEPVKEFQAVIITSVPLGGGLSSSASLEVAFYTFLEALMKSNASSLTEKALKCQKAEHDFAGMPCGIMDQFIAVMAKHGHALLLDCRSMDWEQVPLNDPDIAILVTNSNVRHELSGSEYPERRKHCEEVAQVFGVKSLRELSVQQLDEKAGVLDPKKLQRARHVITEIERTSKAADALKLKDYNQFGKLMVESHESLRDDYEVSCKELDELVNAAIEVDGVYGSRMTGGGFGGCTVTLLKRSSVEGVISHIQSKYKKGATFFICQPVEGAKVIEI
ncbi:unnamed protein product [Darwinula stevensoni]|uniref:Galactokinase n=1 Tax=Darwinula stevensoni TaxID=69355 RepID=A0A7R9FSD7_9CRUS|nr:unnamed protein product [Darwinula stevensoni]CAG0903326.1 unnamed protein product [Darwinula stevensoni]